MSTELDLLSKNELRIEDVDLHDADLRSVAATVAKVLEFDAREVMVTDYSDRTLTLDVLRRSVYAHTLVGREQALLCSLAEHPGIRLGPDARACANGVLGWIAADLDLSDDALASAAASANRIAEVISRRARIVSTGAEIIDGAVRDTNRALLESWLRADGYEVDFAAPVADELWSIVAALNRTAEQGYGLIITTGGVGAETKDCTIEALLEADPSAHTPYICTFEDSRRRHAKPGVRIGVGRVNGTLVVSLPGPTDEVNAGMSRLMPLLAEGRHTNAAIAEAIAQHLRQQWRDAHTHSQRKAVT